KPVGSKATLQQAVVSWAQNGVLADADSNLSVTGATFVRDYCTGVRLKLDKSSQAKLDTVAFNQNTIGLAITEDPAKSGGPLIKPAKAQFNFNAFGLVVGGIAVADLDGDTFSDNQVGATVQTDTSGVAKGFAATKPPAV